MDLAQIAWILGIGGRSESERREQLFDRVQQLLAEVDEPTSLAQLGIAREEFEDSLLGLAKTAFADPSMRTNPRIPLVSEIIELLQIRFAG